MIDETISKPWPTRVTPQMVEAHQRAERERIQAAIKARQERDAKREQEREQKRLERAAADLEAYKDDRRRRWIAATGSIAGFEAAWPQLRAQYAMERMDPVETAQERLRAGGKYSL